MERLPCTHKGTYADDCICQRVQQHRCYIVATCDRDLRRRIRKVGSGGFYVEVPASRPVKGRSTVRLSDMYKVCALAEDTGRLVLKSC